MSGVYIPGMEMPSACMDCPCEYDNCCMVIHKYPEFEEWSTSRPEWCPLIPVHTHGDLIERNKLYEKTAEWEAQALHMVEVTMNDEDTTEWRKWSTVLTERSAFKFDVADAPTIIPADKEGEA